MKNQQRLDRILEPVTKKIQEEVSALMGVEFQLSPPENQLLTKEDSFDLLTGKQIVAKMDIVGDIEGLGCLLLNIKDAIRLGGTLIMLPPAELDEVVRNEDYNEETKDSYGEIANIIAGAYTKIFEEMYPDNCRFVRKEHDILVPVKVDIESDEPVPDQVYYQASSSMAIDGLEMGNLVMLMPAETFGVETESIQAVQKKDEVAGAEEESQDAPQEEEVTAAPIEEKQERSQPEGIEEPPVAETTEPQTAAVDVEKQQKRIDKMLELCQQNISEEVGGLLGVNVKLTDLDNRPVTKEDFLFNEVAGKQVLAHMDVIDEKEDKSHFFIGMSDAIRIGGILIMLPPSEIDVAVSEEDFSVDAEDAYGEIANIISGVYTYVFQEQFSDNIRFVKTDLEEVKPLKVDIDSEEPFSDQLYYMSSSQLTIDEKEYGKIHMLFPAKLLGLESLALEETEPEEEIEIGITTGTAGATSDEGDVVPERVVGTGTDILLVGDDEVEISKIVNYLKTTNLTATSLSFKDNVSSYITDGLKVIVLIMSEVNEQSFGAVIKVSSVCSVPLVAAGPAWTRTKVIKAVKYGVNDILLTPATDNDIKEKIESNMVQLAA